MWLLRNHISNVAQMQRIGRNLNINFQRTISQLSRKRLNRCNLIDLSKKTKLKIILSDKKSHFPYIDINGDIFKANFTATYTLNSNRQKLYKHIESLIKNNNKVEIFDKYFLYDNQNNNNHIDNHYSIKFMENILNSCNGINLIFFVNFNLVMLIS